MALEKVPCPFCAPFDPQTCFACGDTGYVNSIAPKRNTNDATSDAKEACQRVIGDPTVDTTRKTLARMALTIIEEIGLEGTTAFLRGLKIAGMKANQ